MHTIQRVWLINKGVSSRRKMIFELVNCFLNAHFPAISLNFKKMLYHSISLRSPCWISWGQKAASILIIENRFFFFISLKRKITRSFSEKYFRCSHFNWFLKIGCCKKRGTNQQIFRRLSSGQALAKARKGSHVQGVVHLEQTNIALHNNVQET